MVFSYKNTFWVFSISLLCACNESIEEKNWTFEKIESHHSNVTFSNDLTHDVGTKSNLFDFDYFYNGSGVATIDINNDDLPDLLFTANQVQNRLYLNKGDFVFEDITETSGINAGKQWSNGVTVVDINGDGHEDIYISQGGPYESDKRKNLLYINNGDLSFTERAETYGLADQGISTQSAFFDYDRDGDLDCIVMNESTLHGYDPISFQRRILERPKDYYESFSHLYRNDGGKFVDVSKEAGITKPTFGLGLAISDINEDGYPDIYIANDYYLPDNLYINRKNGSFSDRIKTHINHTSFFGMGVDIADINNDGAQDIFVLDMASQDHVRSKTLMASMDVPSFNLLTDAFGFAHQYMFNSLHLNNEQGRFDNVAHLAQVAKTDWSWTALMEDLDLDGHRDLFITNGYRKYALDNDFKAKVNQARQNHQGNVPETIKQQLYDDMPTEALPNILYRNSGDMSFKDIADQVGLSESTYSNGATLADLDRDGDLDIVVNNIDQTALMYRNNASEINNYLTVEVAEPILTCKKIEIFDEGKVITYEPGVTRGYRSALEPIAHFGLGTIGQVDSLVVFWADGTRSLKTNVRANQKMKITKQSARRYVEQRVKTKFKRFSPPALGINYQHIENEYDDFEVEILLPQKQSTLGPSMAQADLNSDGIDDLYIGGASGQPGALYLSDGDSFKASVQAAFTTDADQEDVDAIFFDVDGDGDEDLYVMSGGNEQPKGSDYYQDRLYINNGNALYTRDDQSVLTSLNYSGGVVKTLDYDDDGDLDVIVGNRIIPQSYPIAAPSVLLRNDNGKLVDVTQEQFGDLSSAPEIINDIELTDIDKDGDTDIIIVGEWSGIRVYINQGGNYKLSIRHGELAQLTGWWYSITATDVNDDGLTDFVVGNVGKNIKHKATKDKPFKIYAEDFDETGTLDIVLTSHYKNEEVPVRGRECSSQQMPFIAEKFETYSEFANASIIDIYGKDEVTNAYAKEVVTFESVLLIAQPDGSYTVQTLPNQAQAFPLLGCLSMDLNDDDVDDLLLLGNMYNTEVETPRLDAGSGLVLLSDQESGYRAGLCPRYCFYAIGNTKELHSITVEERKYIIALANNGAPSMFQVVN